MKALALALLCVATLAACSSATDPIVCTDIAVPGLQVAVLDSAGGQPLSTARVVAQSGTFADTATGRSPVGYALLYERPGVYDVSVTSAGYQTWHRAGIAVTSGTCHVNTVSLTARLQP